MFAERGARVVVSDIDEEGGTEVVEAIESSGGEALFVRTDASDPDDCRTLVERTVNRFGDIDIACNNAGIGGAQAPIGEYEIDDWRRVIDINLSGQFYCMRYEIPAMLDNGGGAIVNVSSILGQVGFAGSATQRRWPSSSCSWRRSGLPSSPAPTTRWTTATWRVD